MKEHLAYRDRWVIVVELYLNVLVQDTEASFCESEALSSELRLSEGEVLLPKVKTNPAIKLPSKRSKKKLSML